MTVVTLKCPILTGSCMQVDGYQETVERWKRRAGALSKQCTDLSTVMRKYITGEQRHDTLQDTLHACTDLASLFLDQTRYIWSPSTNSVVDKLPKIFDTFQRQLPSS